MCYVYPRHSPDREEAATGNSTKDKLSNLNDTLDYPPISNTELLDPLEADASTHNVHLRKEHKVNQVSQVTLAGVELMVNPVTKVSLGKLDLQEKTE